MIGHGDAPKASPRPPGGIEGEVGATGQAQGGDVVAFTRERMTLIEPITHEITSPCDFVGAMSGL
jgi:hypothetical protein